MPNPLTLFPATNGYRRRLYDGRVVSVYYDCHPRNEWGEHMREQEQVSAFLNDATGIADDYLDSVRWPRKAGRVVALRRSDLSPLRRNRRRLRLPVQPVDPSRN